MNVSNASAERYASPQFTASFLRAEWADVLFPHEHVAGAIEESPEIDALLLRPDTLAGDGRPGRFYQKVAGLACMWARDLGIRADRICDVGGSAGRMAAELAACFPGAGEIVLAEPSRVFCDWAERMLLGQEFDGWVPMPDELNRPTYRLVERVPIPHRAAQIVICNVAADGVPRPAGYFDVVTCLNVLDRVNDPRALVADLLRILDPGGLLVISSPLQFEEEFTSRNEWIRSLREVLDPGAWDIGEREIDVRYEFVTHRRRMISYLSQVIGAVRTAGK